MRLVFAGTPEAALPALRLLIDSPRHTVAAVLTRPDAAAGRGRRVTRSPVGLLADEHGIEVLTPRRPADPDVLARLTELAPDCAPVVAYGALIPPAALTIPRHGWINLHFSLLPAWRGAAPVQAAIRHGDELTGASTFQIERGLDTGPVFGVVTEPIGAQDTAGELLARLSRSGAQLLLATLDGIADGSLAARPQPAEGVSTAPKVTVADAHVDTALPAVAVHRMIRSVTPEPGAWVVWRDQRLKLGPVAVTAETGLAPGQLRAGRSEVLAGTATTAVRLGTVQPAGRGPLAAADWARGARPRPEERMA